MFEISEREATAMDNYLWHLNNRN